MKRTLWAFFALALLVLVAGGAAFGYYRVTAYMDAPLGLAAPVSITVERGATLQGVLRNLEADGIIAHPRWAYFHARLHKRTQVRAGEYLAGLDDTPLSLLDKIGEGHVRTERFRVLEGHNRWQVRESLAKARWMTPVEFDKLCDNLSFLAAHKVPGPTCEGYLFPETYTFARGLAPESILAAMFDLFHKNFDAVIAGGTGPLGLDARKLTTLASIVEKETGAKSERGRVACVFYNRLTAKPAWRLDTDPTVIYAATLADPRFDGNITRAHLRELDSPYNTYRNYGLPPGPIANAGRAAFEAVVRPLSCSDFFFVSNNQGEHIFCPTIQCHNQAVEKFQVRYFRKGGRKR